MVLESLFHIKFLEITDLLLKHSLIPKKLCLLVTLPSLKQHNCGTNFKVKDVAMKYYGLICALAISQLSAMDRPPQRARESVKPVINAPKNVGQFDWFFEELQKKEGAQVSSSQISEARYLLLDDNLLNQFALRHDMSTPEIKNMIERFFNAVTQKRFNIVLNSRGLMLDSKKSVSEQEVSDFMVLRAFISEYESEQKYDTTKGENYFRSRTSQELEFINNNLNKLLENERLINKFVDSFPKDFITLGNIKVGVSRELAARSAAPSLTKNQQKNADFLYNLYRVGKIDFDTYVPLQTNSELDRIRSLLEESRKPAIQNYLLQKMSQNEINDFQQLYYKIADILKSRSKPKRLPESLNAQEQLLYTFIERYMKEGNSIKLRYRDQDKDEIKKQAKVIIENQASLNKLAEWLSVKPHVATTLITRSSDLFKINEPVGKKPEEILKNPWPDYPQEESAEQAAPVAKLPLIKERIRVFTVQDFITFALDNNPKLNDLIKDSSDEQLAAVLTEVSALIAADEKIIRKYQERFEVTPRKDLAKLRLLVQSVDQEIKRRASEKEAFIKQNINKPHPEYPQSPR